ncbi:MAG TPA: flagellin FliC, partial [Thiomicrorhabdus sp.]|nr:flagellin FliC [Thiomicrorhabdus sp.]
VEIMNTVVSTNLQVGWEANAADIINLTTIGGAAIATAVSMLGVDSTTNAAAAITALDTNLSTLSTARSGVGAVQNRLEYAVSNLQNLSENTSAARSGIQDADFAKESADLAKNQVLQQAGMSMLSQANQSSQNVLSLLR